MGEIRQITARGSYEDIGRAIGSTLADDIGAAVEFFLAHNADVTAYRHSTEGQKLFREAVDTQERLRPEYMAELKAMAAAAGVPEDDVLQMNLPDAFRIPEPDDAGCSTCVIRTDSVAAFGHNEDGLAGNDGKMFLLHAHPTGKPSFTVLGYPGVVVGTAFGFNDRGVCHSINNVTPSERKMGVTRVLLARQLLEAESIDAAVATVTVPERSSGYNYTIASIHERRIVGVEVGPSDHVVRELEGGDFHSNHYVHIPDIAQTVRPSSAHRFDTWRKLYSTDAASSTEYILRVLGSTDDSDYPIFRSLPAADKIVTLTTALFDLDARTLTILARNPDGSFKQQLAFSLDEPAVTVSA